ncbi:mannose-6-phosphate isomerase, class I [Paracnuella aquatica]|uniref:mannose-6-phosphate isomerase, class I n=1 Tax=Paracnuella aquatica TaxID=2268757 RepID=UPI000DEFEE2D|nr:mannose-6-phosphate isomerase, class I [Paracnuella aquatica]RPD51903.1 mannose-6-phosphate isomerase, class I [Paracnuella aquatica]
MSVVQGIFRLKGAVQHYTWGGFQFLPQLLNQQQDGRPWAEYWLGAHPNHPALVVLPNGPQALHQAIAAAPEAILGTAVAGHFGKMPYLLKVLDVRQMLSIQVHPDKASAAVGFEAENRLGIAVNAPNRNYKDDNHKPELMVALSDFWLLHGFKPETALKECLATIPEFDFLMGAFEQGGYEALYRLVMTMPQDEVNSLLAPIIDRILPLYQNGELPKSSEDFWAARAADTFCKNGQYDRGIFSIYLFNLLHLKRGEGVYQPAQMPHAYLEGQNVEIMANSDNVLRAGLTDKHIDVAELLKHVRFEATVPTVLGAHAQVQEELSFTVPAPEFALYQYRLEEGPAHFTASGAEIVLVTDGAVRLSGNGQELELQRGEAALVTAGTACSLTPLQPADVFRAATGKIQGAAKQ